MILNISVCALLPSLDIEVGGKRIVPCRKLDDSIKVQELWSLKIDA